MRALYCENGHLTLHQDYPIPEPAADEALVRVTLAGICSTDLELVRGYVPEFAGVLGHEFVGVVEAAPDESWLGQRVVSNINIGCQTCDICLNNGPEHCPDRRVLGIHDRDGAFADYIAVPLRSLYRVPDNVPDEQAVFTEPLAAALRIREQVRVRPTARTAVIGPGRLGLLVAQVLNRTSQDITVLGRSQRSLELPASWGLKTGFTSDYADNQFDFVVEVTGNAAGFAEALRLLRPLGTLVLKSTFAGDSKIDVTKIVVEEITVVGSRCGPFDLAVRLLEENSILTAPMVMAEFPLRDALAAFEKAAEPGVLKVLLRP
ncbi:MAG: alcohol dehydrogenase catalytic domain-containing protein [Ardenticatenaceae bacterium]|nr:alcohol dehydrogenase catalytic domain-containing protein [Ardenticatenaceae bacterium]